MLADGDVDMNNSLVAHIVSGHSFFSGMTCLLLTVLLQGPGKVRMVQRCLPFIFVVGVMLVALSSTPAPIWYSLTTTGALTLWLISGCWLKRMRTVLTVTAASLLIAGIVNEIPYHTMPRLTALPNKSITIIGDSVTSGMEENEAVTWPKLLSHAHQLEVQDLSHVGETAASAGKRVRKHGVAGSLVIVEIGGNDVLGNTTPEQFAVGLKQLLQELSKGNHQVLMLELPLPPFYHAYGRTQRELAAQFKVALVPKRVFLKVLATDNATLDSIHLSQAGHQLMADTVWDIVGRAIPNEQGR